MQAWDMACGMAITSGEVQQLGQRRSEFLKPKIQTLGCWRSDAYKAYIEYSPEEQVSLSRRFQAAQNVHTNTTPPA